MRNSIIIWFIFFCFTAINIFYSIKYFTTLNVDTSDGWDMFFLKNYHYNKEEQWANLFKFDKYTEDNKKYGNIFSWFELPPNDKWEIVPLKGPIRLHMKAALFYMGWWEVFWWIWRSLGIILWIWFLISLWGYKKMNIVTILFLLLFVPIYAFQIDFLMPILCLFTIIKFNTTKKYFYIVFFTVIAIFLTFIRNEFLLTNIPLYLCIFLSGKTWTERNYILIIFMLGLFFWLSQILISNYAYYWWFLKTGYSLAFEWDGWQSTSISLVQKIIWIILPYWFNFSVTVEKFWFVINSTFWISLLLWAIWWLRERKKINLQILIYILAILYWVFFYWSNPWFSMWNPLYSSYTRYFSGYLLVAGVGVYFIIKNTKKYKKMLLLISTFIIISLPKSQHFLFDYWVLESRLKFSQWVTTYIPSGSTVAWLDLEKHFYFAEYKFIYPSAQYLNEFRLYRDEALKNMDHLDMPIDPKYTDEIMPLQKKSGYIDNMKTYIADGNSIYFVIYKGDDSFYRKKFEWFQIKKINEFNFNKWVYILRVSPA